VAALVIDAMTEEVADMERVLRSLTVHFCAPAAEGAFELATEIVRAGSRVSTVLARLMRDGSPTTLATASFCKTRGSAEEHTDLVMPSVPPAKDLRSMPEVPGMPAFLRNLDVRFCGPTLPFSGAAKAEVAAWVRLREPEPYTHALVALIADSLPPAIASKFSAPRALASVDFRVDFFERAIGIAPEEHLLVAIRSRWAGDGYTEELREVWSPDGRLLAQCRQLIALL
jgi:acyl-CoA thioesterase